MASVDSQVNQDHRVRLVCKGSKVHQVHKVARVSEVVLVNVENQDLLEVQVNQGLLV